MQIAFIRLALFQFLAVGYSVLGVGVLVKLTYGSPAPPIFATFLRDDGFLLFLLPAAWLIWVGISLNRPAGDGGNPPMMLGTGLSLLGFLILLGFIGSVSACWHPMMVVVPEPSPLVSSVHGTPGH